MRFMILVKATQHSEAGKRPTDAVFAERAAYHEALANAGVLLDQAGLKPSSNGWRIRYFWILRLHSRSLLSVIPPQPDDG